MVGITWEEKAVPRNRVASPHSFYSSSFCSAGKRLAQPRFHLPLPQC